MSFESVAAVADAVLFEGYLLYPYRADALKNTYRHLMGMLMPPAWAALEATEPAALQTQVVVLGADPTVDLRARFLLDGATSPGEIGAAVDHLQPAAEVHDGAAALEVRLEPTATATTTGERTWVVTAQLRNASGWTPTATATREDAARHGLAGAHILMHVDGGRFVSATDPPDELRSVAKGLRNRGCWPVLAGPPGTEDLLLASPVILPDHPSVAGSATGDLFDATEIEALLTLRVATLTDDEQQAARRADPRVADLIEAHGTVRPEALDALHSAAQMVRGGLERPDGVRTPAGDLIVRGAEVVLRPAAGGDAQDALLRGRRATVTGVVADARGQVHVAVVPHDGGHDLKAGTGRYLYFSPAEVELAG